MANSLVATDFNFAANVSCNFATQIAFDFVIALDEFTEFGELWLTEILHASIWIDTGSAENFLLARAADAEYVCECDFNALITRKIDTDEACHRAGSFAIPEVLRHSSLPARVESRPPGRESSLSRS